MYIYLDIFECIRENIRKEKTNFKIEEFQRKHRYLQSCCKIRRESNFILRGLMEPYRSSVKFACKTFLASQ